MLACPLKLCFPLHRIVLESQAKGTSKTLYAWDIREWSKYQRVEAGRAKVAEQDLSRSRPLYAAYAALFSSRTFGRWRQGKEGKSKAKHLYEHDLCSFCI